MNKNYVILSIFLASFLFIATYMVILPTYQNQKITREINEDKEIKKGVLRFSAKFFDEPKKVCFTHMEMKSITDQKNQLSIRPLSVLANINAEFKAYCPSYLSATKPIYTTETNFNLWAGKSIPKTTKIIKNLPEGDRCKIVGELNCKYCNYPCSKKVIYVNV